MTGGRSGLRSVLLALVLGGLTVPGPGMAAPGARDIYQVSVRVDSQGGVSEENALKAALARVVVRLSGDRDAVNAVRGKLSKAAALVQSYHYQRETETDGHEQLYLRASFDPASLRAWMVAQQLPVWGGKRPQTLVWLAVNAGSSRALVSAEQYPKLRASLEALAAQRGLPLLFPLMDLQDRKRISYADIEGQFDDAIAAASQRYGAQSVLVGRLSRTPGGLWRVEWGHSLQGEKRDWQDSGRDLASLLAIGIDGATDRLARLLAVQSTASGPARINLRVQGVDTVEDYARVTAYLFGLGPVKDLQVTRLGASRLQLGMIIDGSVAGLERLLSLGSTLRRSGLAEAHDEPRDEAGKADSARGFVGNSSGNSAASEDSNPTLSYQLQP